jgi:hypothetical protein
MKICLFLFNSMSPFSRKKVYGGETQNQAGLVGTLLVKEIVLAALLLEVAQKKLGKFWTLREAKIVDALAHRYQKALALYQKTQKIASS